MSLASPAGDDEPSRCDLTEATLAAAIVLTRLAGTDIAVVSSARSLWRKELALPRAGSPWQVRAQLGRVPGNAVTVTTVDVDTHRHSVMVRHPDGMAPAWWTWSSSRGTDAELTRRARRVLRASRRSPDRALRDLPVLTSAERALHAELGTPSSITEGIDVIEALRLHAVLRPHTTAVLEAGADQARDIHVSYADLEARVARFAAGLRSLLTTPTDVVGVLLPRGVDLIVAILGALRASITFTVLSPATPTSRARRMLDIAGVGVVIAEGNWDLSQRVLTPAQVAAIAPTTSCAIDRIKCPTGAQGRPLTPHAAYVLFTSGSTGEPKGAIISRSALRCYLAAVLPAYRLAAEDRVLQLAEPGFDVLLEEVLPTLTAGARVVIAHPSCLDSPDDFRAFVTAHGITVVNLASSLWVALFAPDGSTATLPGELRLVVVGSERVPVSAFLAWRAVAPSGVGFINAYGTTETTITSIVYNCHEPTATIRRTGSVPIGRPLANTSVRVVDACGDPTPFGAPGELVIGGPSVFSGYLDGDGSTPDYRTGDRVVLDASGVLIHAGRLDNQVKILGRRIEPAEVEAALESLPGVHSALCTTIGSDANTCLVAAVVPGPRGSRPDPAALLSELATLLPEWLVPQRLALTATLPCDDRGKVDRAAIRSLFLSAPHDGTLSPAVSPEQIVADCVAHLLGCAMPRPTDSFFALGGNSVQAIGLVARLAKRFGTVVPARQVFLTPTIAEIARAFTSPQREDPRPIVRRAVRGSFPLTPSQRAMLRFIGTPQRPKPYFEMLEAFRLSGPLDGAALPEALRLLVRENEPLRTTIDPDGQEQRVLPHWEPALDRIDISGLSETHRAAAIEEQLLVARQPFDLTTEPAFRASLTRLAADEHMLILTFHHLFFDGWSYGVCYERLGALYAAQVTQREAAAQVTRHEAAALAERPEFGDYAVWHSQTCTDEVRAADVAYWRRALAGHETPEICRHLAPQCTSSVASRQLGTAVTDAVDTLAAASAVTPFAVLYAAFATVLGHLVASDDLLLTSNDANRYQAGTEQMMGYLTVSQLSRIQPRADDTFGDLMQRAHATLAAARQHMSVQWEDLIGELGLSDAVQFKFSLQDTPAHGQLRLHGLDVRLLPEQATPGGRRAVVVNVWRRIKGYDVQWYSRDDLALPATAQHALTMFAAALGRAVVSPQRTVRELRTALEDHSG